MLISVSIRDKNYKMVDRFYIKEENANECINKTIKHLEEKHTGGKK